MSFVFCKLRDYSSTNGHGGRNLAVEWNDDGKAPSRRDWGRINIYLATGSRDVQYKLQTLATNVSYNLQDASYRIDSSVGPSGGYYFIRFEGTNASAAGTPPMAFSARFNLDGMTGNFNSTIMAQLQGASGTGQLTAASATASSSSPSLFGFTSSTGMATSTTAAAARSSTAASSQSNSVKSSSGAAPASGKLAGYASALVGIAAVGAAFL